MRKTFPTLITILTCSLVYPFGKSLAQGTAFTYQGRLNDGGNPAVGIYDFRFRIAADPAGNNLVAGPLLTNAVPVNSGLFMLTLDFGGGLFTGSNYWLQVDVKTNGAASYVTLVPLQALTPTPYAIFANGASNVSGTVSAAQLSGTVASPRLAGTYSNALNFNNAGNQFTGAFSGDGGGISNVNAATLNGLAATNFWKTAGNSGTTPNANFLGTSDNQPLEIRVNGQRVLRLTPNPNGGPNLLGGSIANVIAPGVVGGVIIGGGSISYFGSPYTNSIASDFGFIGGGGLNSIGTNSPFATLAGGSGNQVGANDSYPFIGGGTGNQIGDFSGFSTISGGLANQIGTNSSQSTIAGGGSDSVGSNNTESTIGGGGGNRILDNSSGSTIAGGSSNQILTNSTSATIAGGLVNHIGPAADYSFIGGGNRNAILTNSQYATIAGGSQNSVLTNSSYATIAGGLLNNIQPTATYSAISGGIGNTNAGSLANIGGGEFNLIQFAADHAVIAGGGNNTVVGSFSLPVYDTIGGGNRNTMQTNSSFCVIAGGQSNVVQAGAAYSTISGGSANIIGSGATNATVVGGTNNVANATAATVVGGFGNSALSPGSVSMGINSLAQGFAAIAMGQNTVSTGNNALALGDGAQATNSGAFVWTDPTGFGFSSTNNNSFNVHASGGVRFVTSGAGMSLDGPLNVPPGTISGSALTNIDAGSISTGKLADSRLSANVALHAGGNNFTGDQNIISGNLGIGTFNPSYPLEVHAQLGYGYFVTTNSSNGSFVILQNSSPSQTELGGLAFYNSTATYQGGVNYLGSSASSILSFVVNTFERMRIDASGRVGIGTAIPSREVEIQSVGDTELGIKSTDIGGHLWTIQSSAVTGNANLDASFQVIDRTLGSPRLFIGTNGLVGIGSTAPDAKLHVADGSAGTVTGNGNSIAVLERSGTGYLSLLTPAANESGIVFGTPNDNTDGGLIFNHGASHGLEFRTGTNITQMTIQANGFVGIGISAPTNKLHVAGGVSAIAFVPTSDRNAKENFEPVSPREVLDKVAALPITTWDYKDYHDGRHMGPMAQDFYAAFQLGGSEKTITTVDPDGVALAAIQGLNELVKEKDRKIERLEERLSRLEKVVSALGSSRGSGVPE